MRRPRKHMSTKPLPLSKAALRMTEIVQAALDRFPPRERQRRVKAYLSGDISAAAGSPTKRESGRTPGSRGISRLY